MVDRVNSGKEKVCTTWIPFFVTSYWLFPQASMTCIPFITWFLLKFYSFKMEWNVNAFMKLSLPVKFNSISKWHDGFFVVLSVSLSWSAAHPNTRVTSPKIIYINSIPGFMQGESRLALWRNCASAYLSFTFVIPKFESQFLKNKNYITSQI